MRNEFVSREAAAEHYGVIVNDDLSVDEAAIFARRAQLRAARQNEAESVPAE